MMQSVAWQHGKVDSVGWCRVVVVLLMVWFSVVMLMVWCGVVLMVWCGVVGVVSCMW